MDTVSKVIDNVNLSWYAILKGVNTMAATPTQIRDGFIISEEKSTVEKRRNSFEEFMSFAGRLPEDFDYKKELEEARAEKYKSTTQTHYKKGETIYGNKHI